MVRPPIEALTTPALCLNSLRPAATPRLFSTTSQGEPTGCTQGREPSFHTHPQYGMPTLAVVLLKGKVSATKFYENRSSTGTSDMHRFRLA